MTSPQEVVRSQELVPVPIAAHPRPLMDAIRNPSGATVFVWIILSIVPLAWPISLYVLLRYLTGHRAPWSLGPLPLDTPLGHRVRYPSVLDLVVIWVIGLFTVVGYVPAVYMTYRYLAGYRTGDQKAERSGSLADRLAQLDTARDSGLISAEEHQARRTAVLDSL